ncbi:GNAT family N-acetyltransferase [Falsibacillus albus]|uniref:GNAT family N-acetyltransferase n=1 Tax=Falsibacillus albus TaxID=2478915 RepID=UPI001314EC5B|nr:GNAT family N-acetyltransferase [Falsibacillus albus]
MLIRRAQLKDAKQISRLCFQLGYEIPENQVEVRLEKILSSKYHAVFVEEAQEGLIAGWCHVFGKFLIQDTYAEIGGIVIDEVFRGKGIGTQLMQKCESWSRANGFSQIKLRSGNERSTAHQFYESIGYERLKGQQVFRKIL